MKLNGDLAVNILEQPILTAEVTSSTSVSNSVAEINDNEFTDLLIGPDRSGVEDHSYTAREETHSLEEDDDEIFLIDHHFLLAEAKTPFSTPRAPTFFSPLNMFQIEALNRLQSLDLMPIHFLGQDWFNTPQHVDALVHLMTRRVNRLAADAAIDQLYGLTTTQLESMVPQQKEFKRLDPDPGQTAVICPKGG